LGKSYSIAKTINYFDEDYEIESGYTEALQVISTIPRHSVSSFDYENWFINKSEKYFESINPLFKKYYQLQAICIYRSLTKGKKRQKADEKIRKLITQTGFVYFTSFPE
jgi:hypothetical protein